MFLPLEDSCEDIIAKAQRGLGIGNKGLIDQSGIDPEVFEAIQSGIIKADYIQPLEKIAQSLSLNPSCLLASAHKSWHPYIKSPLEVITLTMPYTDKLMVNCHIVRHLKTNDAVLFDTGTNPWPILDTIRKHALALKAIFLTHTHPDHVQALKHLLHQLEDIPVFVHIHESIPRTEAFCGDFTFSAGSFLIHTRETPGHSPGGTTYIIQGLGRPIAIVGDTLFAGSMGGTTTQNFQIAKKIINTQILSLDPKTILCPGHGPLTTVALEKKNNPFFA